MLVWYAGEDNLLSWIGMVDNFTGAYINDATATFTVKTRSGTVLDGGLDCPMYYVSASNGNYRGVALASLPLVVGTVYIVEITVMRLGSLRGFRRLTISVADHGPI